MSAAAVTTKRWTVEEYLDRERRAVDKHEFFAGEIFLMAGVSYEHNLIVSNLITALNLALGEKCRVFPSDMRLLVPATGLHTYADASVLCDPPDLTADKPPALRNAALLFEVLSESTESYDRGKKFENYRSLATATDYVLLAQDRVFVEHFSKQPDGSWVLRELRAGSTLRFACGEVQVDDLYRNVLPLLE